MRVSDEQIQILAHEYGGPAPRETEALAREVAAWREAAKPILRAIELDWVSTGGHFHHLLVKYSDGIRLKEVAQKGE
jgi:hypothetical protein